MPCWRWIAAAMAKAASRMIRRSYGHDRMAEDVVAVMDAAGLHGAPLVGYSMGGFIGIARWRRIFRRGVSSLRWAASANITCAGRASPTSTREHWPRRC